MMLIRVLDLETTGIPTPAERHAVCEVGWCDVQVEIADHTTGLVQTHVGPTLDQITNPGRPMPPEARAVHHIGDAEIAESGVPISDAFTRLMEGPPDAFCAHNANFEREFFGGGEVPWLCSYKIALRIWPDAPSHSLQVLRYWLGLEVDHARCMPPHRAGPDAYVGAALIAHIIDQGTPTIAEMIRWSNGPALLPKLTFGKHKGARWEDVPIDYLRWLVDKSDMDRDVKANAKHHLKKREER